MQDNDAVMQTGDLKPSKNFIKTDEELKIILSYQSLEKQLYQDVIDFHLQGTANAAIVIKTIINIKFTKISPHWGSCLMNVTQQEQLEKGWLLEDIRKPLRFTRNVNLEYKVNSLGVRTISQAQYSQEQKKNFSKKQSVSLVNLSQSFTPPAFGYTNSISREKQMLVGLIFFSNDLNNDPHLLPSLIMSKDGMTTARLNFATEEQAKNLAVKEIFSPSNPSGLIFSSPKELFENCKKDYYDPIRGYNESLIRIKWSRNDLRCQIGIFADTLISKLIAQLRAIDMKINLLTDFIPISFYLYDNKENKVFGYLLKKQAEDLNKALNDDDSTIKAMAQIISIYNGTLNADSLSSTEKANILPLLLEGDRLTSITKEQLLLKIFGLNLAALDASIEIKAYFIEYLSGNSKILLSIIENKPKIELSDLGQHVDKWLFYSFQRSIYGATDRDLNPSLNGIKNLLAKNKDLLSEYRNAIAGDLVLANLLHFPEININSQDAQGNTALMLAVEHNNTQIIKNLLQFPGIDVNLQNHDAGDTALLRAIGFNALNVEGINSLLQFPGININLQNHEGETALMQAIRYSNTEKINSLLQFPGININLQNNTGTTALMQAIICNNLTKVNTLLQFPGININLEDHKGETALSLAVRLRSVNIVNRLLTYQNINIDDETLLLLLMKPNRFDEIKKGENIKILNILLPKINFNILIKVLSDTALVDSCDQHIFAILKQAKEQENYQPQFGHILTNHH